jgi:hypothetical protein
MFYFTRAAAIRRKLLEILIKEINERRKGLRDEDTK